MNQKILDIAIVGSDRDAPLVAFLEKSGHHVSLYSIVDWRRDSDRARGRWDLFICGDSELCRKTSLQTPRPAGVVLYVSGQASDEEQVLAEGWADVVVDRESAPREIRNVLPLIAKATTPTPSQEAEHLRLALDAAGVGFWRLDLPSGVVTRSPKHDEIFGYNEAPPTWTYQHFLQEHVHPDDRDMVDTALQDALAGAHVWEFQSRIYRSDDSPGWIWGKGRVLPDELGQATEMVGLVMDISAHKRSQAALLESERRFRQMADSSPVMIWVTDAKGDCSYVSRPWYEFTGQTPEEPLGMGWLNVVHPEDRQSSEEIFSAANARQESFRVEYRMRRQDGVYRWALDTAAPRLDEEGRFLGYIGSVIDITSRKEAEDVLKENDRQKDQYLAMLAHELRNPLAGISNAAELLRQSDSPEHREWCRSIIENQTHHLTHMLDDLLDVSRITRGKIALRRSAVELADVLRSAIQTVQPLLHLRKHTLKTAICDQKMTLLGDRTRLEQVFVNLVNNAAKYTPPGGHVEVRCERIGNSAQVLIIDNGIGMTRDFLAKAFELFVQEDRSLARSEGGLGLGLSLVKTLLDLHQATISADSPGLDQGSTLTVTLPLDLSLDVPEASAVEQTLAGYHRRVMIVDDNVDSGTGLARLLESRGFEVFLCHDGYQGIEEARRSRPDVMLIDLGMPGIEGYQVAQTLRQEGLSECLLVAVTGYGESEARRRSQEAGFDFHFVKPVTMNSLVPILRYRSHRVLLVEDNPVIANTTSLFLRARGFRVLSSDNGESALEHIEQFAPHTVLCDLNLAGRLSGFEVATFVRSQASRAAIRLIAISGDGSDQAREQALEAGFENLLTKPVALPDLEKILREDEPSNVMKEDR